MHAYFPVFLRHSPSNLEYLLFKFAPARIRNGAALYRMILASSER